MSSKIKEWQKAKPKLIKTYLKKGITRCENCGSKFGLSFHHRPKRSSQRYKHDFRHTRLLCPECHNYFEYNEEADKRLFAKARDFDRRTKISIMAKKNKSKKPDWQQPHKCKYCKKVVTILICPFCGKMSI